LIIEVLDSRDPENCRNLEIESQAKQAGKHVVLLLNKIDLVPEDYIKLWQKKLSKDLPTVVFKSGFIAAKQAK